MLEAIFIKTGGRPENPEIAEICAEIALKNSSISDVSDNLKQLEKYVVDRISFLSTQIDKFPDADNDILLGRLQEAKEIRSQIWKLIKKNN